MSDLEDIVDSVEDDMTALQVENDEMQQRLTVLEETVISNIVLSNISDNWQTCTRKYRVSNTF